MMDTQYNRFLELVNQRYSCRNFSERPIPQELLIQVLEAARLAPSACNRQPWRFVVVTDRPTRADILAKSRECFMKAPALIVACGDHSTAWHRVADNKDHTDVDISIAVEHICLAATALGLGTCWVCSFDAEATRRAIAIPDGWEPIALIPIGYPADGEHATPKQRKTPDEIIRWEKF